MYKFTCVAIIFGKQHRECTRKLLEEHRSTLKTAKATKSSDFKLSKCKSSIIQLQIEGFHTNLASALPRTFKIKGQRSRLQRNTAMVKIGLIIDNSAVCQILSNRAICRRIIAISIFELMTFNMSHMLHSAVE